MEVYSMFKPTILSYLNKFSIPVLPYVSLYHIPNTSSPCSTSCAPYSLFLTKTDKWYR